MRMPTQYELWRDIRAAHMTKHIIRVDGMAAARHPTIDAITLVARSCMAAVTLVVESKDEWLLQYRLEDVERLMVNHDKPVDGCEWCPLIAEMEKQR